MLPSETIAGFQACKHRRRVEEENEIRYSLAARCAYQPHCPLVRAESGRLLDHTGAHAHLIRVPLGIRRTLGTAQHTKAALLTADIRRMLDALPDTLAGCRDRALLLVGFAGGFRRSELAALDIDDVLPTDDGLIVKLRRIENRSRRAGKRCGNPVRFHGGDLPRSGTQRLEDRRRHR